MKVTVIPIVICAPGTIPKRIGKGTCGDDNKRMNGNYPDDSIVNIGQNTEKSPGDLRRLAVTQTPVKDHLLTLM